MSVRIASRTRLHSNVDVVEALRDAVDVADVAGLSDADRAILLPTILTLVSQHHVELEQTAIGLHIEPGRRL